MAKRGGGRRPKGAEARSESITFRIAPTLLKRVEAAAAKRKAGGRTDEMVERLEASFHLDDERKALTAPFGGPLKMAYCALFAQILISLEAESGRAWKDDAWTYAQFEKGVQRLLKEWRPGGKVRVPKSKRYAPKHMTDLGELIAGNLFARIVFDPAFRIIAESLGSLPGNDGGRSYPIPGKDE